MRASGVGIGRVYGRGFGRRNALPVRTVMVRCRALCIPMPTDGPRRASVLPCRPNDPTTTAAGPGIRTAQGGQGQRPATPTRVDRGATHHPHRVRPRRDRAVHRHPERVRNRTPATCPTSPRSRTSTWRRARRSSPSDGTELATFAIEDRREIAFEDIPQVMIDAQVAAEDQSFWNNPCVDLRSIVRAFLQNFQAGETVSGASTICQQLVRMRLFGADLLADPGRQVERKIKEAILALRLDDRYAGTEGKQRILEMYMNQSYYGNNAYGIWAAADAYFGKDLTSDAPEDQLTVSEAAMLAGLVRAPSRLDPTTEAVQERGRRRDRLRRPADRHRRSSCGTSSSTRCSSRTSSPRSSTTRRSPRRSSSPRPQNNAYLAPHFVYAVRREANELLEGEDLLDTGGLRIYTTLDYEGYQVSAEKWARHRLRHGPLTDERARRALRRAGAGLDQAAPGSQHQQRRPRDGQLPHRRRARLRRVAPTSTARRRRSTSRTSTSSVRPTASPDPPSSRSRMPPGFEDRRHQPGDDVHGRPDRHRRRLQPAQRRQPRARAGPGARCPQVLAEHPGHEGAAADRQPRTSWRWHRGSAFSSTRRHNGEFAVPSLTLGTLGIHQIDLAGAYGAIANEGRLDGAVPDRANRGLGRQRHLRPCDRCRRRHEQVLSAGLGLPRHRHPGRQHRPIHQPAVGPALPAPDRWRPAAGHAEDRDDERLQGSPGLRLPRRQSGRPRTIRPARSSPASGSATATSARSRTCSRPMGRRSSGTTTWPRSPRTTSCRSTTSSQPDGVTEVTIDAMSGLLPGEHTTTTVVELVRDRLPADGSPTPPIASWRSRPSPGKIWREGCGDFEALPPAGSPDPVRARRPRLEPDLRVFLDLDGWESDHPAWDEANRAWLELLDRPRGGAQRHAARTVPRPDRRAVGAGWKSARPASSRPQRRVRLRRRRRRPRRSRRPLRR